MPQFIRATRRWPCPVCEGLDACSWTPDGLHYCHRKRGEDVLGWIFLSLAEGQTTWGVYRSE